MQKEPGAGYGAGERTALLVLVRQAELGVFLSAVEAGVADGTHTRHPRRQLCRSLLHRTTSQHSRHCSLAIVCSVWSGVCYPVDGLLHLDKLLRRRSQAVHPTHGDGVCRKLLFERDKPELARPSILIRRRNLDFNHRAPDLLEVRPELILRGVCRQPADENLVRLRHLPVRRVIGAGGRAAPSLLKDRPPARCYILRRVPSASLPPPVPAAGLGRRRTGAGARRRHAFACAAPLIHVLLFDAGARGIVLVWRQVQA